jgi:hypothetical protein
MTKSTNEKSGRLGRRSLLKGLGVAAASVPFLSRMRASADGAIPKVVFFGSPSGFLVGPNGDSSRGYEGWRPRGFSGTDAALPASLPEIFTPLERHRDDLLFLENLSHTDVPVRVSAHRMAGNILVGREVIERGDRDYYATGISLDQHIGQLTGTTPLTTAFKIDGFNRGESFWSYLGRDRPVTAIQDPRDAFDRVFAGATDDPVAERRTLRRRRLLDLAGRDLAVLERRVPRADRERVQQHIASIDTLDRQLMAGGVGATCAAPTAPGAYDFTSDQRLPQVIRDHSAIVARALACGFTNVASIQCGSFGGSFYPDWSEYGLSTSYKDHAIAHAFQGIEGAGSDGLSRAAAVGLGVGVQVAYNDLFANLLDELAALEDVDGSRVLDNTLVVHAKPMGQNHDSRKLLWIVAGGRNLGVRGGRFTVVGDGDRNVRHINDLHTSILQAIGLTDEDSFGEPSCNDSPISLG